MILKIKIQGIEKSYCLLSFDCVVLSTVFCQQFFIFLLEGVIVLCRRGEVEVGRNDFLKLQSGQS